MVKTKKVPIGWELTPLSKVLVERTERKGKTDVEIYSVAVNKGIVNQVEHLGRSYAAEDTSNYNLVSFGDIVYTKSPTGDFPYGIVKQSHVKQDVAVSPLYGVYKPGYFYLGLFLDYYFQSHFNANNYLKKIVNKGAKNTILVSNQGFLHNCILLPNDPLEQQEIVEILMTQDKIIALKEKLLEAKKMQNLLTGKIRLAGFNEEWTSFKLGDNCEVVTGATPSTENKLYWGGSILWMSSGELNKKIIYSVDGRITSDGFKAASLKTLPLKCVLIGLAGQGKTRGTVAINYIELCTNQSVAAVLPSKTFVPEFLYYNLDSRYEELRMLSSSGDGTRGGLNIPLIKSINVIAPTYEEQLKIAERLTAADKEIELLTKDIESQKSLKQYLMQQLLTGKIRV